MPSFPPVSPASMNFPPTIGSSSSQHQQTSQQLPTVSQATSSMQSTTGPTGGMKMGNFLDISPSGPNPGGGGNGNMPKKSESPASQFSSCGRSDNMPLNPQSNVGPKSSHFDPISSLAQMSQQLTSNVTGGGPMNGQPPPGMGMGGYGMMNEDGMDCMGGMMPGQYPMMGQNPLMMGGPRSLSPKLTGGGFPGAGPMGPRLMGRSQMGGPFNGTNIQVKASAPNTIQYLPTRPQIGGNQQNRPPSLDFLPRFTNPMNSMDVKMMNQNMPFYSNCSPMDVGHGGGPDQMGGMGGGMPPHMINQNMLMRGMRPQNPNAAALMRMGGPPSHMMGNHFNGSPNNGVGGGPGNPNMNEMFPGNSPNAQMFVAGSKGSPIITNANQGDNIQGHPAMINQSQNHTMPNGPGPNNQPPNGGGPFKQSQFVGPTTADPNYAQQYHNFQQQLYATNTRNQLNNQPGMPGSGLIAPNPNQSFFVPK